MKTLFKDRCFVSGSGIGIGSGIANDLKIHLCALKTVLYGRFGLTKIRKWPKGIGYNIQGVSDELYNYSDFNS